MASTTEKSKRQAAAPTQGTIFVTREHEKQAAASPSGTSLRVFLNVVPDSFRTRGTAGKLSEDRHAVNNYRLYKREDLKRVLQELEESVSKPPKRAVLRRTK